MAAPTPNPKHLPDLLKLVHDNWSPSKTARGRVLRKGAGQHGLFIYDNSPREPGHLHNGNGAIEVIVDKRTESDIQYRARLFEFRNSATPTKPPLSSPFRSKFDTNVDDYIQPGGYFNDHAFEPGDFLVANMFPVHFNLSKMFLFDSP